LGLRTKLWFVRLGTEYVGNLSDPGSKGRAPRVQNIRAKRGDFQDAVAKLPRLHHAQFQVEESKEQGKNEDEEGTNDPHENDLVLLRVQRMLLPLLMKEEFLTQDFWATDVDSAAVGDALSLIVTEEGPVRRNRSATIRKETETIGC
jgi:hypothetical protein